MAPTVKVISAIVVYASFYRWEENSCSKLAKIGWLAAVEFHG